ncbi:MAG TPA: response regulator transcription factor [Kiritimatiellia bacterium]|nr:response regulator transcription factor [Kiritimatiellia bacterium]
MIKLMLVDDHAMLREGLRSKFGTCDDVKVISEAGSAKELMDSLKGASPDVIILDMKLPDANGLAVLRQVKEAISRCKVVVLTMYDHVRYAIHALESGADGFVVKGAPFEELLQAVRTVHGGSTFISSTMASKLVGHLKRGKRKGSLESLSQREFEVLIMLGSGLAVKEIAYQLGVSEKSVTTYRARVMEKLQLASKADLIRFTLEAGLIE